MSHWRLLIQYEHITRVRDWNGSKILSFLQRGLNSRMRRVQVVKILIAWVVPAQRLYLRLNRKCR